MAASSFQVELCSALAFSDLSSDINPIHIDDSYAANSQFGESIHHGANLLLSTLEALCSVSEISDVALFGSFECKFIDAVPASITLLSAFFDDKSVTLYNHTKRVVIISFTGIEESILKKHSINDTDPSLSCSSNWTDFSLSANVGHKATVSYLTPPSHRHKLFPFLANQAPHLINDLCFYSFWIGMQCPAEHSIFSSLIYFTRPKLSLTQSDGSDFKVKLVKYRKSASYGKFFASSLSSSALLDFFLRPAPNDESFEDIPDPSISLLPSNVSRSALQAVVLGASKGIGLEVFTYLAQAGFKVIGTYRTCSNSLEHRIAQLPSTKHLRISFYDTSNADYEIFEKASIIVDCTTPAYLLEILFHYRYPCCILSMRLILLI